MADILNRIYPSYLRKPKVNPVQYVDPDPKVQAEHARHLAKYVFPRQYGLSSVFHVSAPQSKFVAVPIPHFSDREKEIKAKGSVKTPKRLKETLSLLEKLIWRHGKCAYKALRDKSCSSKVCDVTPALELRCWPISQAVKPSKVKPRFAEFTCSHTEVYRYAVLVTDAVIPKAFWGSTRNTKLVLRHIKDFISSRRYETPTLHHILQNFSTADCEWLMPAGIGMQKQSRVSVTDALKRRELLEEFMYWYFSSFLLPLLKTTFYITESSAFRNQVLYFRHDDWDILCAPLIERLTSETFEKITESEAIELLRQRRLGFSFVRLLPKETGVRPIVNLRKRKSAPSQSRPNLLGASVFGTNEFYAKLKAFKNGLLTNHSGNLPKLYFVKLDVQACFDTIEQGKLLRILRDLIAEDAYLIQRYGQISSVLGKIQRKYVKMACPEDDQPHFLEYAAELAHVLRNTIFVDQVIYPSVKRDEVLRLLEEHITENIVKIGKDYYRQMIGIPQGSVLSTLLCSFFYGDLEVKTFKFNEDPGSVLLRHVDDYLLVTTSLPKAQNFLQTMNRGHPEYGCIIAQDKTLTNFDNGAHVMNVTDPHQLKFPWCGYSIDMQNLSISVDYARYQGNCLQDSLTVEKGKRSGAAFIHKMIQQVKLRSHIIYSDSGLNTEQTIYLNVYQNFVLTAMKMHPPQVRPFPASFKGFSAAVPFAGKGRTRLHGPYSFLTPRRTLYEWKQSEDPPTVHPDSLS
ncbi:hypothetical protein FIBSPDRAFT_910389 [Athelia psychrophila]|uniref:Telomerase reverse transcriptase n=1 Tax=Athelia psychrophila TaxID=1759441 RepID=A0A166L9R7_9AGAM|nr:hypothetical protein FIBSPDRAFT_910389 [Fibularhizoctonia sp. CBS 109695]